MGGAHERSTRHPPRRWSDAVRTRAEARHRTVDCGPPRDARSGVRRRHRTGSRRAPARDEARQGLARGPGPDEPTERCGADRSELAQGEGATLSTRHPGPPRRGRASIRFLKLPTADVWREPVWADNDLIATVCRLHAMLEREENETGRIYLTPAAIRVLTGARKIDRAWRILARLAAIGVVEVDRLSRPPGGSNRRDLDRSGRSFARPAENRLDCASILVRKWPELHGFGNRLDRQNRGGPSAAPPYSALPDRQLSVPSAPRPTEVAQLDRPAMARATSEALQAIERARGRWTGRPTS